MTDCPQLPFIYDWGGNINTPVWRTGDTLFKYGALASLENAYDFDPWPSPRTGANRMKACWDALHTQLDYLI